MAKLKFSQGRNTYDNQPSQYCATDFEDFVSKISQTGSSRKGEAYICAPMAEGAHADTLKYPAIAPGLIPRRPKRSEGVHHE